MKKSSISYFVLILIFGITGAMAWNLFLKEYRGEDTINIAVFPREINLWSAEEYPITEREYEVLETRNVFVREYTSPKGQKVMLFVVYSQNNRKISHPPEVCYTGGGHSVLSKTPLVIEVDGEPRPLKVNKLLSLERLSKVSKERNLQAPKKKDIIYLEK